MRDWHIYKKISSKNILIGSTIKDNSFYNKFSLAIHTNDNKEQIIKNRKVFMSHFKGFKAVTMQQIHSDKIIDIDKYDILNGWVELPLEADGFITTKRNILLNIMTADCLAILASDEENGVIGAAHAGWRGTKLKISKKLILNMLNKSAKLENIKCAISPGICGKCYEVGQDVIDNFNRYTDAIVKKDNGKFLFDNLKVNITQLQELGINLNNIETTNYCTYCNNDKFFSYRGGDKKGRFVSFIALT